MVFFFVSRVESVIKQFTCDPGGRILKLVLCDFNINEIVWFQKCC